MTSVRLAMLHACNTADPGRWTNAEPIPPDDRVPVAEVMRRIHRYNIAVARTMGRRHHANHRPASSNILPPLGYIYLAAD